MAVQTLTIPARTYQVGITRTSRALPSTQAYSHVDMSVDFSPWTTPSTATVSIIIEFSSDGGLTWNHLLSFLEETPPPYTDKLGNPTSTVVAEWNTPDPIDPTHVRGSASVTGQSVSLGQITLNAS